MNTEVAVNITRIGAAATTKSLRELIEWASEQIGQRFKHVGRIYCMWHAETETETLIITAEAPNKDAAAAALTTLFRKQGVVRYLFIDEAWTMEYDAGIAPDELQRIQRDGVSRHPNRREIVMIYAEDKDGVQQATRDIIRPAKGKARLGPLTFADYTGFEGRWTGLLAHLNTQRKLH